MGVDRYLLKPVPLERLIAESVEVLEERRREEAELAKDKKKG